MGEAVGADVADKFGPDGIELDFGKSVYALIDPMPAVLCGRCG